MVPYSKIEDAVRALAGAAHPEKIVLFGAEPTTTCIDCKTGC